MSTAILTKHATSAASGDDLLAAYGQLSGENTDDIESAVVDGATNLLHFAIAQCGPEIWPVLVGRIEANLTEEWNDHLAGDPDPNLAGS